MSVSPSACAKSGNKRIRTKSFRTTELLHFDRSSTEAMTIHSGSCVCGAIRFEVEGTFEKFFLCHCGRCRKDTGSAHAANLFSSSAKIRWLSGQEKVKTFRVPGTR